MLFVWQLQDLHSKVLVLLEVATSHDEIFGQWLDKVTAPGYVYYSPELDINKGKVKQTGKATEVKSSFFGFSWFFSSLYSEKQLLVLQFYFPSFHCCVVVDC